MSQGWDIYGGGRPRGGTPEEELPTMKDTQQVKEEDPDRKIDGLDPQIGPFAL